MLLAGATFAFAGCNNEGGDGDKQIKIPDQTQLTQVVGSDDTNGSSAVNFTTTGPWSSSIEDVTVKGNEASWVSISPDHGDAAGDYTMTITLTPNTSTESRKANVKIICNDAVVTIEVEQKGVGQPVEEAQKKISQIKITDPDGSVSVMSIGYDSLGRPASLKSMYDNELTYECTMAYTNGVVVCDYKDYDGSLVEAGTETYKFIDGRVASVFDSREGKVTTAYEYNGEGYKTKYIEYYYNSDSTSVQYVTEYAWNNGLMVGEAEYGEDGGLSLRRAYEYTQTAMKELAININEVICDNDYPDVLGLTGKQPAVLLSKITTTEDKWDKDNGVDELSYEYDSEGYVTVIRDKWTPDSPTSSGYTVVFEISYQ